MGIVYCIGLPNDLIVDYYMKLLKERGKQQQYPSVYVYPVFFYKMLKKKGFEFVKGTTDVLNMS